MRRVSLTSLALIVLMAMGGSAFAQTASQQSATGSPHLQTDLLCQTCGGGGGGGGGGYTPKNISPGTNNPSVGALPLNYTGPVLSENNPVGGVLAREAPGAAVLPSTGLMYIAYVTRNFTDNSSNLRDAPVQIRSFNGNSNGTSYVNLVANTGQVYSSGNPSLIASGNQLYLATNTHLNGVYQTNVYVTSDGVNWTNTNLFFQGADYSPSLAVDNTYLYVGLRNASTHTLELCRAPMGTLVFNCTNFSGTRAMNFNPGLAIVTIGTASVLYAGFEEQDNYHELRMFVSNDQGQTFAEGTDIAASGNDDQTSVGPSLVAYNSALYVGFRTNDGDHKYLYRTSANGNNFYKNPGQFPIGGSPTLVSGYGLQFNPTQLYLFTTTNNNPDTDNNAYVTDDSLVHNLLEYTGHP